MSGNEPDPFCSARIWMVRCGGNVVGPVSIDQMERGLAVGKIPGDAEMAHQDGDEWRPVADVFESVRRRSQPPAATPPPEPLAQPQQPVPPPAPSLRYPEEPVSIPQQGVLESLFG